MTRSGGRACKGGTSGRDVDVPFDQSEFPTTGQEPPHSPVIVAKLCRLSRDVHSLGSDEASGAIHRHRARHRYRSIHAAHLRLYEKERRMIGVRTKEALAAARARGVKLGGHREQSDITKAEAQQHAEGWRSVFEELSGLSARKAAEEL